MNEAVKVKWVEALRSGKYNQTRGFLHDAEGFCCLGVLCEVARLEGLDVTVSRQLDSDDEETSDVFLYDGHEAFLPEKVQVWAELDSDNPGVHLSDEEHGAFWMHLSELNDDRRSFEQIATFIEEQL